MVRVVLATAATIACGALVLPYEGKAFVLVEAAAMALVYVAVLVLTGELGRADVALVANLAARRAAKGTRAS